MCPVYSQVMANIDKTSSHLEKAEKSKMIQQQSGDTLSPVVVRDQPEKSESSDKELPEPIRHPRKMPNLPPIGISQVKDMLTKMPEQNIMRQVANNLTSGAYHSDDSGSEMAMQGLFDCILETTLHHNDDDDEENSPKEMPCGFCSKIFNSKLRLQTHILVMHSQEDPSLLNVTHVAPRRELQRSHSNSKTAGSEANDAKTRPLSQGLFNMEMSQMVESDLVKHLPPKQRVKMSPKTRLISKDQVECLQSRMSADLPSDSTVTQPIPESTTKQAPHLKIVSSPKADTQSCSSNQGDDEDRKSTICLPSQKEDIETGATRELRITRFRGRAILDNSSSSPSSQLHSPGPSGEKRRSSRQQIKLKESPSSSHSSSKRKSLVNASTLEIKRPKSSQDTSRGVKRRLYPTKGSR